jgi:hypothetical protein
VIDESCPIGEYRIVDGVPVAAEHVRDLVHAPAELCRRRLNTDPLSPL